MVEFSLGRIINLVDSAGWEDSGQKDEGREDRREAMAAHVRWGSLVGLSGLLGCGRPSHGCFGVRVGGGEVGRARLVWR